MAKAWKDVIASPQYQALTEEQKAQAQAQYFDEVVAPKAGDKWAEARDQFYAAYPPPQQQKEEPSLSNKLAIGSLVVKVQGKLQSRLVAVW